MFKQMKTKLAVVVASLAMFAAPLVAIPAVASAQVSGSDIIGGTGNGTPDIQENLKCGSTLTTTGTSCTVQGGTDKVNTIITTIVNIFSILVGIVSVIMIIYGGFLYVTSGGDSGKVGNAKNAIIYAIVGLVVVALAQFIVQFVLDKVTTTTA